MKGKKEKKKSYLGARIFSGIVLTAVVVSSKYYPDIYSDNVKKVIYYTVKEHFNLDGVTEFFLHMAGKINA